MSSSRAPALALLCTVLAVAPGASAGKRSRIPPHPSQLVYDSLGWQVPAGEPFRHVLGDSLVVYAASDRSLPRVVLTGHVRWGTLCEPAGMEGVGALMCALLKSGGVEGIPADTVDMLLDLFAISVRFSPSDSRVEFSASFLSEFTDTAFALLARMLFAPAFEPARLEQERASQIESIRHRFDTPGPTVSAAHAKAMYAGSAASRMSTVGSVERITREDLVMLHRQVVHRGNIILAVSGDFDTDSMLVRVDRFCPRSVEQHRPTVFPEAAISTPHRLVLVPMSTSQSYVRMSLPMFRRPHPDYYAVTVLNYVLGGGSFSSRLNATVRSDAGLTYSIYSSVVSSYHYPGTFYVQFFTKTPSTLEAIRLSVAEIERIRQEGVTAEELEAAKKVLIDGLPSMFRRTEDIVEHYSWNEYYGRDMDHYRAYPDRVRAVSAAEVLRVAQTWLHPDSLVYAVVADTAALFAADTLEAFSLRSLTPVRVVSPDSLALLP